MELIFQRRETDSKLASKYILPHIVSKTNQSMEKIEQSQGTQRDGKGSGSKTHVGDCLVICYYSRCT